MPKSNSKKSRATFYRPETIVVSLLLLMVLSFKVIFNHTSKRQFVVLHFRIEFVFSDLDSWLLHSLKSIQVVRKGPIIYKTKFQLNQLHCIDTIMFIHKCTYIYYHTKSHVESVRLKMNRHVKISNSDFFYDYNTFLRWYMFREKKIAWKCSNFFKFKIVNFWGRFEEKK